MDRKSRNNNYGRSASEKDRRQRCSEYDKNISNKRRRSDEIEEYPGVFKIRLIGNNTYGNESTNKYLKGCFFFKAVHVKKLSHQDAYKEIDILKLISSDSIQKLIHFEVHLDFVLLAFEDYVKDFSDVFYSIKNKEYEDVFYNIKNEDAIKQLGDGIEYLHDRNIVHRNIQPEAILIMSGEAYMKLIVKISGFQYASASSKENNRKLIPVKDRFWEPPEMKTDKMYTKKSDIYCFGCFIACLTQNPIDQQKPFLYFEPKQL